VREAANRGWRIFPVTQLAKLTGNPDLLMGDATCEVSLNFRKHPEPAAVGIQTSFSGMPAVHNQKVTKTRRQHEQPRVRGRNCASPNLSTFPPGQKTWAKSSKAAKRHHRVHMSFIRGPGGAWHCRFHKDDLAKTPISKLFFFYDAAKSLR
jgi:hypothetical protein